MGYDFVGREKELQQLESMLQRSKPSITVIYGRRRIGKTELMKKAVSQQQHLWFEGTEGLSTKQQMDRFMLQMTDQTGITPEAPAKNWAELFHTLTPHFKVNPCVLILDEFQWLANYQNSVVSDLKMIWDRYWSQISGMKLILCGSIASFMKDNVIKSSALYGRTETIIHLQALKLREVALLLNKGPAETIEAYNLFGGIPLYIAMLRDHGSSVVLATEELAFTPNGYFTNEYKRIFTSHFGKNPVYEKLIRLLAAHPYGLTRNKITATKNIGEGGRLTSYLRNLEDAGFIASTTPIDKKSTSKLINYEIIDPYIRFYFAFIEPNRKKIEAQGGPLFPAISRSAKYRSWLGRSFEYTCRAHTYELSDKLGFRAVSYSAGPFFRSASEATHGVQLDLLFDRADNVLLVCEMKYSQNKIGVTILKELERKESILTEFFPSKTILSTLITANGVTKEVQEHLGPNRIVSIKDLLA